MHHTNPHNPLLPQPQHILHQSIAIKRAPAKAKRTHLLHGLNDGPAPVPVDHETDRRDAQVRVRRRLAEDGDVAAGAEIGEEDGLEGLLARPDGRPGARRGGGLGAEVGDDAGDGGRELVVGGGEAELAFERGGGVEVVAEGGQGGFLGGGAGVEQGDVGAVDLWLCASRLILEKGRGRVAKRGRALVFYEGQKGKGGEGACLVPRKGVEINVEVFDVYLPVRSIRYGVNAEHGSGDGVHHLSDALDVVDRA
jgi:hypothetical protein